MTGSPPRGEGQGQPSPLNLHVRLLPGEGAGLVLRFTCRLGHPVERVWAALTSEAELAIWYPTRVRIDPQPGGRISFSFPGADPFHGVVLEVEPPTLLVFTTLDDTLRWQLAEAEGGCALTLDNIVAHPEHAPYTAAGFDINLHQLATLLDHGASRVQRREMPPPDDLVDHYRTVLPRP